MDGRMAEGLRKELVGLTPRLRGFAMSLVGSEAKADGLVAATLQAAWRTREARPDGESVEVWLLGLLRRAHADACPGCSLPPLDDAPVSEAERAWRDRYGDLLTALDRLAPSARQALLLVAASGADDQSAARILGVSIDAARRQVRQAQGAVVEGLGTLDQSSEGSGEPSPEA